MADKQRPLRLLLSIAPEEDPSDLINFAAWFSRSTPVSVRAAGTFMRPWPMTGLSKMAGRYEKWLHKRSKEYRQLILKASRKSDLSQKYWDEKPAVFSDGASESLAITTSANDFQADLVVLGSAGQTPMGQFWPDATTETLLHSSPHKLALVPKDAKFSKRGITRINVAVLKSDIEQEFELLSLAAHKATVLDVPLRIIAFSPMGITDGNEALPKLNLERDINEEWHEFALSMLDRARDHVLNTPEDLELETTIAAGGGWAGANDSIKWKKGDLLWLSSSPIGTLTRVFLGSTETEFVRHIRVPIVIFPSRADTHSD